MAAPATSGTGVVVATPESVAYLAHCLGGHYRADNLLGPAVLLPAVRGHLLSLDQMRASASAPLLRQVLQVGAGYAEFAGWLSQDAGDASRARSYYSLAHEWAEAAGDHRMASFVLMRRSVQAVTQGDGAYAANLAKAAQRDRSPETARVRALAAQTEALGHAAAGDPSEAARALDAAETFTAEAEGLPADGDPSDGRYCDLPLYLRISRAKVALNLGDADQAIRAFNDVLVSLPVEYRRDRGQYLARIAQASVLAGLPEQACAHALESLGIARETGSTRTVDDIRTFATSLDQRWSALREVGLLRDSLNLSPAS